MVTLYSAWHIVLFSRHFGGCRYQNAEFSVCTPFGRRDGQGRELAVFVENKPELYSEKILKVSWPLKCLWMKVWREIMPNSRWNGTNSILGDTVSLPVSSPERHTVTCSLSWLDAEYSDKIQDHKAHMPCCLYNSLSSLQIICGAHRHVHLVSHTQRIWRQRRQLWSRNLKWTLAKEVEWTENLFGN